MKVCCETKHPFVVVCRVAVRSFGVTGQTSSRRSIECKRLKCTVYMVYIRETLSRAGRKCVGNLGRESKAVVFLGDLV